MQTLRGSCHCGQLGIEFEATAPPETMTARRCGCTFCRRHGAFHVTDPGGRITFRIGDEAATSRYRFGLATADFLICTRCGVYVGAFMDDERGGLGVVNVLALDEHARFAAPAETLDFDAEDVATRLARRRGRWTPARIVGPDAA